MWATLRVLFISLFGFTHIFCISTEQRDFLNAIGDHNQPSAYPSREPVPSSVVPPNQTPSSTTEPTLNPGQEPIPEPEMPDLPKSMPKTAGAITTAAKAPKEPGLIKAPKLPTPEPKVITPEAPKLPDLEPKVVAPKAPKLPTPEPKTIAPEAPKVIHPVKGHEVAKKAKQVDEKKDSEVVLQVEAHSSGLDTINIDSGGNWLEKRIWFKKAEDLFGQIREAVQKAEDTRVEFIQHVHSVGQNMDEFYENVNYEKGQVDEMLKSTLDEIAQASQKRGGDVSDKERGIKETIKVEQKQIEQIGNDLKKIADFDTQIDKTMMQAFKTIENCRELETKSWNNYKEIGAELDDKKARSLYYEIENAYKNIEQNVAYLEHTLLPYLTDKLISTAQDTMNSIKTAMSSLESKGIHLDKLIEEYTQQDLKLEHERELEAEKNAEESWESSEKKKLEQKQKEKEAQIWYNRWLATITDYSMQVWDKLVELLPFLQNVGCYLKCVACSVCEWLSDIFVSVQETGKTAFCSVKDLFCNLIGQ